jgi:hypothetical protein
MIDDYEKSEYFLKLMTTEFDTCLHTLISIGSALIYYEIKSSIARTDDNKDLYDLSLKATLVIVSISVLLFSKFYY